MSAITLLFNIYFISTLDNLEKLRTWRDNNDRKSREVIEIWLTNLVFNIAKLGKDSKILILLYI